MAIKNKTTVSLQMIVKDEFEKVKSLVSDAYNFVDHIYITISDKRTYERAQSFWASDKMHVDYRPWNDNFADARNHNFSHSKCTYQFWLDADDKFDFSEIPNLVKLAEEKGYESIYLPYDYARDKHDRTMVIHWRERLIKRSTGFQWRGALHETLLIDRQFSATRLESPAVIHDSPDIGGSIKRNHQILLKEAQKVPVDPRILHYLGLSYATNEEYEKAIETLKQYIAVGGWDEEIYRSLIKISEIYEILGNDEDARFYAAQAITIMPLYPQAYYVLAQIEFAHNQFEECLKYLKIALSTPMPNTMSIVDPTMPDRGKILGACSEFQLGHYGDALAILKTSNDPTVQELLPSFEFEASKERFIEIAPALTKHMNDKKLYDALEEDLKYDSRMKWLRDAVVQPKKWPKKSIVFFCGAGYEEWGPHTLDKGMGGSEEAIIYLSRELAKLGFNVTIYGAVNEQIQENPDGNHYVRYEPWRMFDQRDTFDTLVLWRQPSGANQFKARVKIIDMHDKLEAKAVPAYDDVTYFFKSNYHRELYPHIKKAVVIGNGINKKDFKNVSA